MTEIALTPERILDTAEDVLRRYGPAKATVVDVARALGVSHGSVYRHFASKAALRDAVAERWLERVSAPLQAIAAGRGKAPVRLRTWMDTLVATKRRLVAEDPELFATYIGIVADAKSVIGKHVETLVGQLARIIEDGNARRELSAGDPRTAARAVFDATGRFHNPRHAPEWSDPDIDDAFEGVWTLVLKGLGAPRA